MKPTSVISSNATFYLWIRAWIRASYTENNNFGFDEGSVYLPDEEVESSLFEHCCRLEKISTWIIREKNEACGYPDIWVWLQRWSRNTLPPLKRNPSKLKNFRGRSCRKTLSAWLQRTLLLKLCKLRRKMEIFVGLSIRFPIWGAKYESVNFLVSHNQTVFFQSKHRSRKSKLLFRRTMKWNIEKSLLRTLLPMPANQDAHFDVEKKCFDVYNWKLYLN